MQTAYIRDFFVSLNIKKQANLWFSLNVQKCFLLTGTLAPLTLQPEPLLFAYCSINMVSLSYDIVYHF